MGTNVDEYQGHRDTVSKQDEYRCDGGNAQTGVLYIFTLLLLRLYCDLLYEDRLFSLSSSSRHASLNVFCQTVSSCASDSVADNGRCKRSTKSDGASGVKFSYNSYTCCFKH